MKQFVFGALLISWLVSPCTAQESIGRYKITTNPVMVIDTKTGKIWRAVRDDKHEYIMVPVPYRGDGGEPKSLPLYANDPWPPTIADRVEQLEKETKNSN